MVSTVHEALRDLFRDDPWLCVELLATQHRLDGTSIEGASCVDPTVPQNVPPSLSADVVVLLRAREAPVLVVAVEVQLEREDEKRWTWPVYLSSLRREHRCPALLLVIAPNASVASWARAAIEVGPGASITPVVLGPSDIPVVTDRALAAERYGLAVLSAVAHGRERDRGLDAVIAALIAVDALDEPRATVYTAAIWDALDRAAQRALEVLMTTNQPRIETNFERRMRELFEEKWRSEGLAKGLAEGRAEGLEKGRAEGLEKGRAEGRAEGLEKGRAEGRAEGLEKGRAEGLEKGRAEGRAEGLVEGEAEALRTVLVARGFTVDAAIEARIRQCADHAILRRWISRAVNAANLDAVFDDDP
jgi:flagellar biosynthesis/type III secretory pathway protein FliH